MAWELEDQILSINKRDEELRTRLTKENPGAETTISRSRAVLSKLKSELEQKVKEREDA